MSSTRQDNPTTSNTKPRKNTGRKIISRIFFRRTMITLLLVAAQLLLIIYMVYSLTQHSPELVTISYLVSMVFVVYLININVKEEFKIAWLIPMCLIPVFGIFMYLFVLINPGTRTLRKVLNKETKNMIPFFKENKARTDWIANEDAHIGPLVHYLFYHGGYPAYTDTEVTYFPIGEDFFADILARLETAKSYIFMEYFIVNEGFMWNSILEILKRKVKEGVPVYFMYDGTCAMTTVPYHYDRTLREYGICAKMFSPIVPFISTHQNNRDHRKILVIDGACAYTGGINLADEYINREERCGHWKDVAIRMDGPAVYSFIAMFLQLWNASEPEDKKLSVKQYLRPSARSMPANGYVIPYGDDAVNNEDIAENIYIDIMNHAHKYVYIMTPYFIVDSEILNAIKFAAKRGIDVRIMLPHVPDKKWALSIARTYYRGLITSGVKVYEYTPGFVHAKLFVSDDKKACVGSVNLDYRSLYHHFECGAFLYECDAIPDMKKDFLQTQKKCMKIQLSDYKKLPLAERLFGRVMRVFAPLL